MPVEHFLRGRWFDSITAHLIKTIMKNFKKQFEKEDIMEFLQESNAIEGVYDDVSLKNAKKAWDFLIKQPKLTVAVILQVHKIMAKDSKLAVDEIGFFRRVPVYIGGHEAVNCIKIPELIDSWIIDTETSIQIPGAAGSNIKLDHIEYERIHPFVDFNGRTGRMFMNWQRVKADLPILIIHEGDEQYSYYGWFRS